MTMSKSYELTRYRLDSQESEHALGDEDAESGGSDSVQGRPSWTRDIDFFMACLGGSVGLGNVWKFPYLCYKNGGGAFLIPYFITMLMASLPLFIMEVGIGQYMGKGAHIAWGIVPLFQGLGLAGVVIVFYINCYYNVILAWTLLYLYHSFSSPLPWDSCDASWNTDRCVADYPKNANRSGRNDNSISSFATNNSSNNSNITRDSNTTTVLADSATEFWEKKVLDLSGGIQDMRTPKWDLALCLLLAWVLVYLCICKGIKSSGKVMYFTAPAPYVFMIIILIRNATLEGAVDGVKYYLQPNLTKLSELSVWTDAGKQTFFSSCVVQGIVLTFGSYNKFKHNFCRDSVIFGFVNAFSSLFAGFLVFTVLGFMAFQQGRPIEEVAESGPGLVFIAYPKAMAQMPLPQFWSVVFFLMIILLGLDSEFVAVEAVTTNFIDQYPSILRRAIRKELFIALVCIASFLFGLIYTCRGGMYAFQLVDFYTGGKTLLLMGFLNVIAITYFYGIRRFFDNMTMMVGSKWLKYLFPYLAVCWTVASPAICLMLFVLSVLNENELTYKRPNQPLYRYPAWADVIGWMLTVSCVIWIPGVTVYRFVQFGFSWKTFKKMLVPFHLEPHQMRPEDKLEKRLGDLEQDASA